jgi:hypothetical protein
LLIYPAAFSFRHGIELYVKHLLILADRFLSTGVRIKKTHMLSDNWNSLSNLLSRLPPEAVNQLEVSNVDDIIADFIQIDPSGQVFRYPEDIKGNKHLTALGVINVEVLADGMRVVFDCFETWDSSLISLLESKGIAPHSV